jgi:hypothetical protein
MRKLTVCLLCLLISSCSTTNGRKGMGPRPGSPEAIAEANSGRPKTPPSCPTMLNRARAGGAVGSVLGLIAASALGSPVMGLLYQVAGYGVGAASTDSCKNKEAPVATAQAPGQIQERKSVLPPLPPLRTDNIQEEEIR